MRQTRQKALGCGEHWLENQTPPEMRADGGVMGWLALCASSPPPACLLPCFCFLLFFSRPASEMTAHPSLQPLTAAALCWGESVTGVGSAELDQENQSPGGPSPVCGYCVISLEGRAEPVKKVLAPKCFPRSLSWALGFGMQLSGIHCFGSFEFSVREVHSWEWCFLASS